MPSYMKFGQVVQEMSFLEKVYARRRMDDGQRPSAQVSY